MIKTKNILATTLIISTLGSFGAAAAKPTPAQQYAGRIVLNADQKNQVWYMHPQNGQRYWLKDDAACFAVARDQAIGITDQNLKKITAPVPDPKLSRRLRGRFLLAVNQRGRLFYVNAADGALSAVVDAAACLPTLTTTGTETKTTDLQRIRMNSDQLLFDPFFNQVATARMVGGKLKAGSYAHQILPIASLTKLITALVILDQHPDWKKEITITADDLDYPKAYVDPGDITSEIKFAAGDTVTTRDLWGAMLMASSNQAAGLLAKHSGLSRDAFVSAMNRKAKTLGLRKTLLAEPSGLDPSNVSTAAEMVKIAAAAFAQPKIAATSVLAELTIAARQPDGTIRTIPVANRNYSLLQFGVSGAKVGFLNEAQRTVAVLHDSTVAVVLHARSMKERNTLLQNLLGIDKTK